MLQRIEAGAQVLCSGCGREFTAALPAEGSGTTVFWKSLLPHSAESLRE